MNRSTVFLLAAPALVAFSYRGDGVSYSPAEGLVLTKHFTQSDETTLDEMSVSINGQEQDPDMVGMDQEMSSSMEIIVIDEYGAISDGRPARLKRTYDTISSNTNMEMSHPMMGDQSMNMVGESELEGEVVLFAWNDDDGEYMLSFAEDNGSDEELLEDLTEDTDLRGLLPSSEVSEGDTWEIEPDELRAIFAFGGSLKIEVESDADMGMGMGSSGSTPAPHDFIDELDGTVSAEYSGTRDEDGTQVAVITIAISVNTAKDMTEFFEAAMEEAGDEMPMEMDINGFDMEFEFEGEALLLWNLEGGHLHSFEMNGETSTAMDMMMAMDMGGGEMEVETSMLMVGTQTTLLEVDGANQ